MIITDRIHFHFLEFLFTTMENYYSIVSWYSSLQSRIEQLLQVFAATHYVHRLIILHMQCTYVHWTMVGMVELIYRARTQAFRVSIAPKHAFPRFIYTINLRQHVITFP